MPIAAKCAGAALLLLLVSRGSRPAQRDSAALETAQVSSTQPEGGTQAAQQHIQRMPSPMLNADAAGQQHTGAFQFLQPRFTTSMPDSKPHITFEKARSEVRDAVGNSACCEFPRALVVEWHMRRTCKHVGAPGRLRLRTVCSYAFHQACSFNVCVDIKDNLLLALLKWLRRVRLPQPQRPRRGK